MNANDIVLSVSNLSCELENTEYYTISKLNPKTILNITVNKIIKMCIVNNTCFSLSFIIKNNDESFDMEDIQINKKELFGLMSKICYAKKFSIENAVNVYLSDTDDSFYNYPNVDKSVPVDTSFIGLYEKREVYIQTKSIDSLLNLEDLDLFLSR